MRKLFKELYFAHSRRSEKLKVKLRLWINFFLFLQFSFHLYSVISAKLSSGHLSLAWICLPSSFFFFSLGNNVVDVFQEIERTFKSAHCLNVNYTLQIPMVLLSSQQVNAAFSSPDRILPQTQKPPSQFLSSPSFGSSFHFTNNFRLLISVTSAAWAPWTANNFQFQTSNIFCCPTGHFPILERLIRRSAFLNYKKFDIEALTFWNDRSGLWQAGFILSCCVTFLRPS